MISTSAVIITIVNCINLICNAFLLKNVSPTVDGMLGGHAYISPVDIKGSTEFLKEFFEVLHDDVVQVSKGVKWSKA